MRQAIGGMLAAVLCGLAVAHGDEGLTIGRDGRPVGHLVPPAGDRAAASLIQSTCARYLKTSFGVELPVAANAEAPGRYIIVGNSDNNASLAAIVRSGLALTNDDLGDEGFQLLTHADGRRQFVIVYGRTPRALKHGCQELLFFHTRATTDRLEIDAPLNVVKTPAVGYRGVYILPCWSAQDSFESWQRVLRFHSELTINRNWFWLDGFPVAGHTGEYAGTALADERNVQALIDLCDDEQMKFLIGGGWFNWHHQKAVGKDYARGREYYLAYLKAFRGFDGFYIEPTGEGKEIKEWRPECDMLRELIARVLKERPEFEFAIAIGKFNNAEYLNLMAQLDPKRVYWWWCWGDPLKEQVLDLYPSVLRWHLSQRMSDFHGSLEPPFPEERALAGVVTSYDPGQGYGNPWDGWGKLGWDKPRNFDPYDVPYFAHQYHYRERCWDPEMTEAAFVARLHRRLFDANAPKESGEWYWRLSRITLDCAHGRKPTAEQLEPLRRFVDSLDGSRFTPRMADAIARMAKAVGHLERIAREPDPPPPTK